MKPLLVRIVCFGAMLAAGAAHAAPQAATSVAPVLELYYNAKTGTIVRSKNVAQVANPSTGTYCITPINSIDPASIYPVANAEYAASAFVPYGGYVAWQDTTLASDCPSGDLEIKTLYSGTMQPTIGFSLIVFK